MCSSDLVLEKILESPLDCKEIKLVNPKGNQSRIFTGRTDAEAPMLWPPDGKNWLIWKDPDAGKDWSLEEKGTTEDEMVRWYHWLDGHEFEQAPGDGDGQGSLVCCSPRGRKELDTTERLNWTELIENVGFPGGASGKEPAYQNKRQRRRGFNPWIGKIPWSRKWQPLQYSCLGNPMDSGAWGVQSMGLQRVRHDWAQHTSSQDTGVLSRESL